MTPEQHTLQHAVFGDKLAIKQLIRSIGSQISASVTVEQIVKLRLVRIAVKAIAAARWGRDWQTT